MIVYRKFNDIKTVQTKTYIYDLKSVILKMQQIDDLDLRLLSELKKNGNISVPILAKKLEINASVLYSRIKRLLRKKLIKKFTIDIDESQLGFQVKASVGINRDPKFKDSIHNALMETAEIEHLCEVTGRFDIIISVLAKDLEQLHSVIIEKIGRIEGIQNTETFVELEKTDKVNDDNLVDLLRFYELIQEIKVANGIQV